MSPRPYVLLSVAASLDGYLDDTSTTRLLLSNEEDFDRVDEVRAGVDAILVGANTIRADNPRLTVRGQPGARQPWRVVLSRSGKLPRGARIFTDAFARHALVYRETKLDVFLRKLGAKEITSVLIEGGGDILGQALDRRLIDKVQIYVAPVLTGGSSIAFAGKGAGETKDTAFLGCY